jgi:hypothetical protein
LAEILPCQLLTLKRLSKINFGWYLYGMRIFLSFPSELESQADGIAQSLRNCDYEVFFSHDDLPPGDSFDARVENAIANSDFMVFLVSPESVTKGRYTLTEMAFARKKWPNPSRHVLPVMAALTPLETIPNYLKAVTILEPEGNTAAEVRAAVDEILRTPTAGPSFDRSLIRPLAAMTLVSAFFCYLTFVYADQILTFSFIQSGGVTILPGIIFGLVVATCNAIFGVQDRFLLALVVAVTTMAWVAAYDSSATTFTVLDQYSKTITPADNGPSSDEKPAGTPAAASGTAAMQATERLSSNPIFGYVVGPIGGAVGGAITLLGIIVTNPRFRKLESVLVCWVTAAVAGATFGVAGSKVGSYFWFVIFAVWQTGLIFTIARGFPSGTAQIPQWLARITLSASYTSRDAE